MVDPTRRYREVQVQTAAQDDLLMLLLDGKEDEFIAEILCVAALSCR